MNSDKLHPIVEAMTLGPWKVWTSNSVRRITAHGQQDGGVLSAVSQRYGGAADLEGNNREADLAAIVTLANHAPALVELVKACEAWRDAAETVVCRCPGNLDSHALSCGLAKADADLMGALSAVIAIGADHD